MGKKPSMFSRNYRREIRRRRIKYIGVSVIGILVVILIIFSGSFMTILGNVRNSLNSKIQNNNESKIEANNNEPIKENRDEKEIEVKEENFDITLNSQQVVNLRYTINGEYKLFNEVQENNKVYYNVAPNKEKIVLLDKLTQEVYLIDNNKAIKNITKKEYISTKDEVFKRENVISRIKNYIWIDTPTFIDDTHIAYVSNLPWINSNGIKYLWIYDVNSGEHKGYYKIKSNDLKLGKINQKGLTIIVEGKEMYVDFNGNLQM